MQLQDPDEPSSSTGILSISLGSSGTSLPTTGVAASGVAPAHAIAYMKKGATLLKFGRVGDPHFRTFKLSDDLTKLTWTSPKKKSHESSVLVSEIKELRLGQNTKTFRKNRKPEYEKLAFSLLYHQKTLDIVCKDKKEFDIWVTGIRSLSTEYEQIKEQAQNGGAENGDSQQTGNEDAITVMFKGKKTIVQKREDSNDVYSWGQGVNGRLGHGDENDQLVPKVIEGLLGKDVRGIDCGPAHSAAWTVNGDIYTWGAGSNGRLGHGHELDRFSPLIVNGLKGKNIVQVACGDYHSAALTDNGKVFIWGKGGDGRLGLADDRTVLTPRELTTLNTTFIKFISCGYVTTAACSDTGVLFMWGGNEKGQMGTGDKVNQPLPNQVEALKGEKIVRVTCATWHTAAINEKGQLFTWGDGTNGKLGHGNDAEQLLPKMVAELAATRVTQIDCGDFHSLALTDTGEVFSWGEGTYGQLGHGPAVTIYTTPLALGPPLKGLNIIQIACGSNHSAALADTGQLFTWGHGANGRLGHGNEEDQRVPSALANVQGKKVRVITCGGSHSFATVVHGWVPDDESDQCMACKTIFTVIRRRHHCRNCGGLFCGACSSKKFALLKAGFSDQVRVCDKCYDTLSKTSL